MKHKGEKACKFTLCKTALCCNQSSRPTKTSVNGKLVQCPDCNNSLKCIGGHKRHCKGMSQAKIPRKILSTLAV